MPMTQHGSFIGIVPESIQALLQQISLHHPAVERKQFVELPFLVVVQMNPAGQQQPVLSLDQLPCRPPRPWKSRTKRGIPTFPPRRRRRTAFTPKSKTRQNRGFLQILAQNRLCTALSVTD